MPSICEVSGQHQVQEPKKRVLSIHQQCMFNTVLQQAVVWAQWVSRLFHRAALSIKYGSIVVLTNSGVSTPSAKPDLERRSRWVSRHTRFQREMAILEDLYQHQIYQDEFCSLQFRYRSLLYKHSYILTRMCNGTCYFMHVQKRQRSNEDVPLLQNWLTNRTMSFG